MTSSPVWPPSSLGWTDPEGNEVDLRCSGKDIGGGQASVFETTAVEVESRRTIATYAVKIAKDIEANDFLEKEIYRYELLQKVSRSPKEWLLPYHGSGWFEAHKDKLRFLVFEWCADGSLFATLTTGTNPNRAIGLSDRLRWAAEACRVINRFHAAAGHQTVHMDIKPANLLIRSKADKTLVLCDFAGSRGPSQRLGGEFSVPQGAKTAGYAPPELELPVKPTCQADYYSLAVTVCEIVTGQSPTHTVERSAFTDEGRKLREWRRNASSDELKIYEQDELNKPALHKLLNHEHNLVEDDFDKRISSVFGGSEALQGLVGDLNKALRVNLSVLPEDRTSAPVQLEDILRRLSSAVSEQSCGLDSLPLPVNRPTYPSVNVVGVPAQSPLPIAALGKVAPLDTSDAANLADAEPQPKSPTVPTVETPEVCETLGAAVNPPTPEPDTTASVDDNTLDELDLDEEENEAVVPLVAVPRLRRRIRRWVVVGLAAVLLLFALPAAFSEVEDAPTAEKDGAVEETPAQTDGQEPTGQRSTPTPTPSESPPEKTKPLSTPGAGAKPSSNQHQASMAPNRTIPRDFRVPVTTSPPIQVEIPQIDPANPPATSVDPHNCMLKFLPVLGQLDIGAKVANTPLVAGTSQPIATGSRVVVSSSGLTDVADTLACKQSNQVISLKCHYELPKRNPITCQWES